ncbi:hypothetical protein G3576_12280 [Roseomonas stagni]|uniref:Sel1 repeat family protein n=1 Tax=Falsiroseomonas algicola TaxID=2716930 RepID=A0A6M1LKG7_9PROT|nr:hypothetical protein [Falsiroseomonas algicola]NGM20793.1 hypothetical protein [Falsiroseomonas algicola]
MAAKARLRLVEGRDAEGGWEALAPDWQALPGASLLGLPSGTRPPERRVALLHPRRGVAILDLMAEEAPPLSPRESAATVVALQGRLCAAGFPQVFPGHLPVLHLGVTEAALPGLVRRLDEAFRATAPLTLPEGEAWMGPLRRALTSLPGGLPLPGQVPTDRRPAQASRRRKLAGAACLGAAGLGLAVAMLAVRLPVAPPAAIAASTDVVLAGLAGDAGSDAVEVPALPAADPLAAFDRALAALERSTRPEPRLLLLASAEADSLPVLDTPPADAPPATEPPRGTERVEPVPEPEEARLPDLAAEAPRVAERVEPVPEPEEARLPDLAAEAPRVAERVEPVPEPEEARLPDLAAEAPRVAERVDPVPEPEEARLPDLAAEAPRVAERVEPVPEPEAARLPDLAAEAPRVAPPVTAPARPSPAAAPTGPRVAALDPRLVTALLTRGEALMARGDISGARLLFSRAAQAGSAEGALAMARSFDATVLAGLGARGIRPDAAQADYWHRRAAELGGVR